MANDIDIIFVVVVVVVVYDNARMKECRDHFSSPKSCRSKHKNCCNKIKCVSLMEHEKDQITPP